MRRVPSRSGRATLALECRKEVHATEAPIHRPGAIERAITFPVALEMTTNSGARPPPYVVSSVFATVARLTKPATIALPNAGAAKSATDRPVTASDVGARSTGAAVAAASQLAPA